MMGRFYHLTSIRFDSDHSRGVSTYDMRLLNLSRSVVILWDFGHLQSDLE